MCSGNDVRFLGEAAFRAVRDDSPESSFLWSIIAITPTCHSKISQTIGGFGNGSYSITMKSNASHSCVEKGILPLQCCVP